MDRDDVSRRRLLRLGGLGTVAGITGCLRLGDSGGEQTDTQTGTNAPTQPPTSNQTPTSSPENAQFTFEYSAQERTARINCDSGGGIKAGEVQIQSTAGKEVLWPDLGSTAAAPDEYLSSGATAILGETILNWGQAVSPEETIRLVYRGRESPMTIGRYTPPRTTTVSTSVPPTESETSTPDPDPDPTTTTEPTNPETTTEPPSTTNPDGTWEFVDGFEQYSLGTQLHNTDRWTVVDAPNGDPQNAFEIDNLDMNGEGDKAVGTSPDENLFRAAAVSRDIDPWSYPESGFEFRAIIGTGGGENQPRVGILTADNSMFIELDNHPYREEGIRIKDLAGDKQYIGSINAETYEVYITGTTDQTLTFYHRPERNSEWNEYSKQTDYSGDIEGAYLGTNNGGQIDHIRLRRIS